MASFEARFQGLPAIAGLKVSRLLAQPGDGVGADQPLLLVESDALSLELPAGCTGRVKSLHVQAGDAVQPNALFAIIDEDASVEITAAPVPVQAPAVSAPAQPAVCDAALLPHATPSMRQRAREMGVPVAGLATSPAAAAAPSRGGLDVLPWPKVDHARFGPVQRQPRSRVQKISAANLHRNWVVIPHVTNQDLADITELEAFRRRLNQAPAIEGASSPTKVTLLAFLVKAAVAALKAYPQFNASLDGDDLVLKQYYHIGFAADTPHGLMVPVIVDADRKSVLEIAAEVATLAASAREGRLKPAQMSGGCFSISSLGGIGSTSFTPIINAPEVAILGVCPSSWQPRCDGQAVVPRLMLPLSLSWDHRVVDGAAAARFLGHIARLLADVQLLQE